MHGAANAPRSTAPPTARPAMQAGPPPQQAFLLPPRITLYASDSDRARAEPDPSASRKGSKGTAWTDAEHIAFLEGLRCCGRGQWRHIAKFYVKSRTPTQVASHAQKHFIRQLHGSKRRSRFSSIEHALRHQAPQAVEAPQCEDSPVATFQPVAYPLAAAFAAPSAAVAAPAPHAPEFPPAFAAPPAPAPRQAPARAARVKKEKRSPEPAAARPTARPPARRKGGSPPHALPALESDEEEAAVLALVELSGQAARLSASPHPAPPLPLFHPAKLAALVSA